MCPFCCGQECVNLCGDLSYVWIDECYMSINNGEDFINLGSCAVHMRELHIPPRLLASALLPSTILFWQAIVGQFNHKWLSIHISSECGTDSCAVALGCLKGWVPGAVGTYCDDSTLTALLFDTNIATWGRLALCRLNMYDDEDNIPFRPVASLDMRLLPCVWPSFHKEFEEAPSMEHYISTLCCKFPPHWTVLQGDEEQDGVRVLNFFSDELDLDDDNVREDFEVVLTQRRLYVRMAESAAMGLDTFNVDIASIRGAFTWTGTYVFFDDFID